jgi:hypothetical protein
LEVPGRRAICFLSEKQSFLVKRRTTRTSIPQVTSRRLNRLLAQQPEMRDHSSEEFMTNAQLIVIMAVSPIVTALTVGIAGAWLTGDLRVIGLAGLGAAIVGAAVVGLQLAREAPPSDSDDCQEEQRRTAG